MNALGGVKLSWAMYRKASMRSCFAAGETTSLAKEIYLRMFGFFAKKLQGAGLGFRKKLGQILLIVFDAFAA